MTEGAGSYLVVGNPCLDRIDNGYVLGGSSFYAAIQASLFGMSAQVVGLVEPAVRADLETRLTPYQVDLSGLLLAESTTVFENRYDDAGSRHQVMISPGERIPAAQMPTTSCTVLHLAPIADEVDVPATVLRARAGFVGLTGQGLLRRREAGVVRLHEARLPPKTAAAIDAVIVGREEAGFCQALLDDVHEAGGVVVVTDGAAGAVAHRGGTTTGIPAQPVVAVDPTGAGDVFATALFIGLSRGESLEVAGSWASVAAALCVRGEGAETIAGLDDVLRLAGEPAS
jgi:sugar/nucleoside kinase (ribokinase family)